jgi:hypothetical membrane protein
MTTIRATHLVRLPRTIASVLPARTGIRAVAGVRIPPGWALVSAGLAPVALTWAWVVADSVQPARYSPMRQTVSVLSGHAGTDRWLMTGGLVLVGICYFVTAAGLRDIPTVARAVLVVTGAAAVGVAACPQPTHGSTPQHLFFTGLGELALAVLPAIVSLHRLDHRLLSARASGIVAALFGVLFFWLVLELRGGAQLGLAERVTSSVQTCWPFVMALALRHSNRIDGDSPDLALTAAGYGTR